MFRMELASAQWRTCVHLKILENVLWKSRTRRSVKR
jgi:hypothetical protein